MPNVTLVDQNQVPIGTAGNALVTSGGGGGGGAVTIADGADVTQGAIADAAYTSGSGSVISLLKGLFARLIGAALTARIVSAAGSTNLTAVKSSAGRVYGIQGYNAATSARFLKLYNIASGSVTVGTSAITKTLYLPPSSAFAYDFPEGYSFATAISFAMTTGVADNDTGALTAADVIALNVDYT